MLCKIVKIWSRKKFFIHELKLIGTNQSIDVLSQCLQQDELAQDVIIALLHIHQAGYDISNALNEALESSSGKTQIALIKALGSIRNGDSLELLESLLTQKIQNWLWLPLDQWPILPMKIHPQNY